MGADDDHRPGPNPKDPRFACGEGSDDVPTKPNLPNLPNAMSKTGQVDAPSSYAIAGKVLLAASGAFAGILLALIALHMYNRSRRQHFRHRRRLLRSLAISGAGEERDGASPRGLDPAVLRALPVLAAGPGAGDCAVCLAEFEPGEKARALPRCGHRFHVECIDAWFRGNSTCPLCRADVEAPDAAAAAEAQPEVRIEVAGATAAAKGRAPAMGRLPSGTDLEKTRRIFASTRSASF